ncbi:phage protein GemA/Gp16 family protein [Desulforamulus ruminis]|uniref:Mu-like prophage protein gp16 n=1 Tax=Desulforamulus ruminis (strain ATCC 23193 / DSM 2154 / NCIMB 8452 / DL) TaxID=696281 RepID=F6DTH1_DESRL|nr:phage protein GemA/Gp16 family protein [Desulforamulus ruminis]AEG60033.1 hypothetical protein Desru_1769 [Desulforamulus ruminis DSM 2154]
MATRITAPQLKKIWATARELGMDEDVLRARVAALTGSESISKLTSQQARNVIDNLAPKAQINRASREQLWKINQLAEQLGWKDNPKRLLGFVKKYARVDALGWLTRDQAWRVTEGLKKLISKQKVHKVVK